MTVRNAVVAGIRSGVFVLLCLVSRANSASEMQTSHPDFQPLLYDVDDTIRFDGTSVITCASGTRRVSGLPTSHLLPYIAAFLRQPDGGMIMAGMFSKVKPYSGGTDWAESSSAVRMNPDGTWDSGWKLDIQCDDTLKVVSISALAGDSAGNIYVGGVFATPGNEGHRNLARFNAKGELDEAWRLDTNGEVIALALDGDGNLFVAGSFTQIGGVQQSWLAKIRDGKVVEEWKPTTIPTPVRALAIDGSSLYAGGSGLTYVDGVFYSVRGAGLVKLSRAGKGLADSRWQPPAIDGTVYTLAVDRRGFLYAGGIFTVHDQQRSNIARFFASNGDLDKIWQGGNSDGFPYNPLFQGAVIAPAVQAIAVDEKDNIFVGGSFDRSSYASTGSERMSLAKIDSTGKFDTAWAQNYGTSSIPYAISALLVDGGWLDMGGLIDRSQEGGYVAARRRFLGTMNLDQRGIGGSWYNPQTSGQGFMLHVYPDLIGEKTGLLAGDWYTFSSPGESEKTPADASGQRWYVIDGQASSILPYAEVGLYETRGGRFDAPPTVSAVPVGHGVLTFKDCNTGSLDYGFDDGRKGSIPLIRLTGNVTCAETGDSGQPPSNSLLSGPWHDPATSGQGVMVDANPVSEVLAMGWYTYARDGSGEQRWYVLQGPLAPGAWSAEVSIATATGGKLDAPEPVAGVRIVGKAQVKFESCVSMTLDYAFDDGPSGRMTLQPVGPVSADCRL